MSVVIRMAHKLYEYQTKRYYSSYEIGVQDWGQGGLGGYPVAALAFA